MRSVSSGGAEGTGEAALTADKTGECTLMHGDCGRLGSGLLVSGIVTILLVPGTGVLDPLCKSETVAERWRTGIELGIGNFSGAGGNDDVDSMGTSPLDSLSRVDDRDDACDGTGGGGGEEGPAREEGPCDGDTLVSGGDGWFWMALNRS